MGDDQAVADDEPIRMFGDPRFTQVTRGPDRRGATPSPPGNSEVLGQTPPGLHRTSPIDPSSIVRLGHGDVIATLLFALGLLVLIVTIVVGALILYNAKSVGALSNPWDSTRVAIGLAVLAVGVVQSAVLIGLSRVIAYLRGGLRHGDVEAR